MNRLLRTLWVSEAVTCARDLQNDAPDFLSHIVFFIRLRGVLHELARHYGTRPEPHEYAFMKTMLGERPSDDDLLAQYDSIRQTISDVRSEFDSQELTYIEYMRHRQCHPLLNNYDLLEKSWDSATVKNALALEDPRITFREFHDSWMAILGRYGSDEGAAVEFAKRTLPRLQVLHRLLDKPFKGLAG